MTSDMTSQALAKKEAQKIFYKIESLVFDAVRVELKDEIDAIITYYLTEERKLVQKSAKQPRNENVTTSEASQETAKQTASKDSEKIPADEANDETGDDYAAIRQIIDDYIKQSLEEQAPAIIAETLSQALRAWDHNAKKPS